MKQRLELGDIQAILVGSYPKLRAASYAMLSVQDPARARKWVRDLSTRVRRASQGVPDTGTCINVAFTFAGLERLELVAQARRGFSRELQEGMWNNERRRRILGDVGHNDPDGWCWGGAKNSEIDVLLLLFAGDDGAQERLFAEERTQFEQAGLKLVERLSSSDLGGRETLRVSGRNLAAAPEEHDRLARRSTGGRRRRVCPRLRERLQPVHQPAPRRPDSRSRGNSS